MFGRRRRLLRLAVSLVILLAAAFAAYAVWRHYTVAPWTRDGTVRVQVANIAPQVSGSIIEVRVRDNQVVHKGDVLYAIDRVDYQVALATATAELQNRQADLAVKQSQARRRQELTTLSTSVEEQQQYAGQAQIAQALLAGAEANLAQAKVNLERTEVRSTVNGIVTNLLMRVGDYAHAGTSNIAVIDTDSFWIDGYFEETKMAGIHVGDRASAALLGYGQPVLGQVESITRGISPANAGPATQGLPGVQPVYTWVRLAQRIPVRIRIDQVPPGMVLAAGMTCTVTVGDGDRAPLAALLGRIFGEPRPAQGTAPTGPMGGSTGTPAGSPGEISRENAAGASAGLSAPAGAAPASRAPRAASPP